MTERTIYCCQCQGEVAARLTDGAEIYPHRPDLADLPFWKCPTCGNFVGCHHKTKNRTEPLGNIPTAELKKARQHIHRILDPLWAHDKGRRKSIYAELSRNLGYQYHTASIRTIEEARTVYRMVQEIAKRVRA